MSTYLLMEIPPVFNFEREPLGKFSLLQTYSYTTYIFIRTSAWLYVLRFNLMSYSSWPPYCFVPSVQHQQNNIKIFPNIREGRKSAEEKYFCGIAFQTCSEGGRACKSEWWLSLCRKIPKHNARHTSYWMKN